MPDLPNRSIEDAGHVSEVRQAVSNSVSGLYDSALCPICLEHPHNAVLLHCSSFNNGCRAFICNTSSRHSNCLDNFLLSSSPSPSSRNFNPYNQSKFPPCPLCRGVVRCWVVHQAARAALDLKQRDCTFENCEFRGSYKELRLHARTDHPFVRPAEVVQHPEENGPVIQRERQFPGMVVREIIDDGPSEQGGGEEMGFRRLIQMTYTRNHAVTVSGEPPQLVSATLTLPNGGTGSLNGASIVITAQYSGRGSGGASNSISDIEIVYENANRSGGDEGRNVREHSRRYSRNRRSRGSRWSPYMRSR